MAQARNSSNSVNKTVARPRSSNVVVNKARVVDQSPNVVVNKTVEQPRSPNVVVNKARVIDRIPNKTVEQPVSVSTARVIKTQDQILNQRRERDNELVKGKFTFEEVPGGTLTFSFRKYKLDAVKNYSLKDGNVFTLPRCVAKHLVTSGKIPIHEYAVDENGKSFARVVRYKRRYHFESLEFFDDADLEPSKLFLR